MTDQKTGAGDSSDRPLVETKDIPSLSVPETGVPVLSPIQVPALEEFHWNFAEFHEEYVRNYITFADTKAAWAFTIASGLLAYLFSQTSTQQALLNPKWSIEILVLLIGASLLIVSGFFSFRVVAPRLYSPSGEGVVFFGSVAAKADATSYVSSISGLDKRELTEARLKHCFDVSVVCARKYADLKKAIWIGLPGLVFSIVALLLA